MKFLIAVLIICGVILIGEYVITAIKTPSILATYISVPKEKK